MKLTELAPGDSGLAAAQPGPDLPAAGWLESEYVASGTATSYSAESMPTDGEFVLRPSLSADYATRVAVRRPRGDWSGTLVVEWLNVSSGNDVAPDWTYLADELVRRGHAWAGVSAQFVGVEGGRGAVPVPGGPSAGLRGKPRYAELHHPGDAYCYDMFTQVGEHLRGVLGATCVLAIGESQSACTLTTYLNGVQPLAGVFDGFLVHSRGGAASPLGVPGSGLKIADILAGAPTRIRADLEVPVLVVQTETDLTFVDRHTGVAKDYYGFEGESVSQVVWEDFNYPVHSGYVVNGWWRILWLILGLAPLLLAITGVSTWLVRRKTRRAHKLATKAGRAPPAVPDDVAEQLAEDPEQDPELARSDWPRR